MQESERHEVIKKLDNFPNGSKNVNTKKPARKSMNCSNGSRYPARMTMAHGEHLCESR